MWKLNHRWRRQYLNQNKKFRTRICDLHQAEASEVKLAAEHQQPEPPEPSQTSTRNRKQHDRFGETIPTNLLRKRGSDGFKLTSRNLEVLLKCQRTKEQINWRTLSISNGHKTKLYSNSVLVLSLSFWPINHMLKLISPTNRKLILTSIELQENLDEGRKSSPGFRTKIYSPVNQLKYFKANQSFLFIFSHT